ncbi:C-X-C chemokine receptor type 3-like [Acipenser oxyrinchus oxyrinchus]|uniref:C-X-C chemokine receptor type 3 n=1 Tax=Acipenser oxyrinchus oxyrinchus TaxID=40147 RepID=A0AAD8CP91_ACIOX|nr:C-X-C chemokine receptor type 3-like [Acipenser oxyrinchus oxyrinchus]
MDENLTDTMEDWGISEKTSFTGDDLINYSEYDNYNYSYNYSSDSCCGQVCTQHAMLSFDRVFQPVLYSLIFVLGLLGNGLVIAVLLQFKRTWNVTDTFILHLALTDSLLVITLPFWAAEAVHGWVFGTGLCKIVGATFKVNFYCGIFLLGCISLDRYLSIVHAVQMYTRRKPWVVQASCVIVWGVCFLMSVPDLVFLEAVKDDRRDGRTECLHNYSIDTAGQWRLFSRLLYHIAGFFLPSVVMVFCYTMILHTLGKSQGLQKRKAMKVILALVVTFFVCWTPYNVVIFLDTLVSEKAMEPTCEMQNFLDIGKTITSSLGYLHCCLNPILYAFVGVKFRNNLLDVLSTLGCNIKKHVRPVGRRGSNWSESGDTSYSGI